MTEKNLDDIFGEESGPEGIDLGEEPAADAAGGGEGMTLDSDLAGLLDDSASGGESAGVEGAGGGEEMTLDADLESSLGGGEAGGGEAGGEESGGGMELGGLLGEDEPGAAAPAPAPAAGGRAGADGLTQSKSALSRREAVNLDFLLDVKLDVTFEVGRSKMMISDLLTLGQGSVVELHRLVGEELDLLVNGKLIAKGEVVVVNEKFGCKISEIVSPEERVKHLAGY